MMNQTETQSYAELLESLRTRYRTRHEIEYLVSGMMVRVTIPAGTPCVPADNLPGTQFWLSEFPGMSEREQLYGEDVGYLLQEEEVEQY